MIAKRGSCAHKKKKINAKKKKKGPNKQKDKMDKLGKPKRKREL